MKEFDEYLRGKAAREPITVPELVKNRIEQTLAELPEVEVSTKPRRTLARILAFAACFLFAALFLFPNMSVAYAQALEQIPLVGDLVRVVTIRNYFYADERHEMNITVPGILDEGSEAAEQINRDVDQFTTTLINQFYDTLEITGGTGYGSIDIDYETVTDTERWFTLRLNVTETTASSYSYFRYYHIDKRNGQVVELGDLFAVEDFSEVLVSEIKRQMRQQMEGNGDSVYWADGSVGMPEFTAVDRSHNFYWNSAGQLVIVFDEYEVAPGYMGTPEFVIDPDVIREILKPEFLL